MRKLILLQTTVLSFFILSTGCRKNSNLDFSTINTQYISKINEWFSNMKRSNPLKANVKAIEELEKNIQLGALKKVNLSSDENLLVIPISDNFQTRITTSKKVFKYLILWQGKDNNIESGIIQELIPSNEHTSINIGDFKAFYLKEPSSYDGLVEQSTVYLRYFGELEYNKGALEKERYISRKGNGNNSSQKIKSTSITDTNALHTNGIKCIDWYWMTYVNGVLIHEEYLFTSCYDDCTTTTTGNPSDSIKIKINCSNGQGDGAPSNPMKGLSINVKDPCFLEVVNKLMDRSARSSIFNMIQNTFGGDYSMYSWIINEVPDIKGSTEDNPRWAYSNPTPIDNGDGTYSFVMDLNLKALQGASQEFIATIIYHEAYHAFALANGIDIKKHHPNMVKDYRSSLYHALSMTLPSSTTNLNTLTWAGLTISTIDEWKFMPIDDQLAVYALLKDNLKGGGQGIRCQ